MSPSSSSSSIALSGSSRPGANLGKNRQSRGGGVMPSPFFFRMDLSGDGLLDEGERCIRTFVFLVLTDRFVFWGGRTGTDSSLLLWATIVHEDDEDSVLEEAKVVALPASDTGDAAGDVSRDWLPSSEEISVSKLGLILKTAVVLQR